MLDLPGPFGGRRPVNAFPHYCSLKSVVPAAFTPYLRLLPNPRQTLKKDGFL